MDNVKEVIAKFESESESKVIFAVEAGSKAWGFPSRDSDHDLRLVYFRPEYKKDVWDFQNGIVAKYDGIDIAGFSVEKFFYMAQQSKLTPFEMVRSPTRYVGKELDEDENFFANCLREVVLMFYSPRVMFEALTGSARNKFTSAFGGKNPSIKSLQHCVRFAYMARAVWGGTLPNVVLPDRCPVIGQSFETVKRLRLLSEKEWHDYEESDAFVSNMADLHEYVSFIFAHKAMAERLNDRNFPEDICQQGNNIFRAVMQACYRHEFEGI